jgi:RNAse (barnase) inhibitor barstar
MGARVSPFRFDDSDLPGSPALTAEVPAGIRSKDALLDELDRLLRFPDYFGGNWDALWECIRDLSWLPAGPVVLRHRDLPLAGDVAGQKTYVSILKDTVEKKWTVPGQRLRDFVVVFPPETRDHIDWLLRSAEHDDKQ